MKTIATLFPRAVPVSFNKAVGRIAYHFARDLGWKAILGYCEIADSPAPGWYSDVVEVHRLGSVGLNDRVSQLRHLSGFLLRNARRIDLLNLYDLRPETYILAELYRRLNPQGVVFIKLDMDQRAVRQLLRPSPLARLHLEALRRGSVDFFIVETRPVADQVKAVFARLSKPVHLAPIGFDTRRNVSIDEVLQQKEKIILSVGRLGSEQKHNELLLNAAASVPRDALEGWKIVWIGEDEGGFRSRADALVRAHPWLADKIEFVEHISDPELLYDWYRRAAVFALSSRWESFGTVLTEALYFGCVPVTTSVGGAADLTDGGRLGELVVPEDADGYSEAVRRAVTLTSDERSRIGRRLHVRVCEAYSWEAVCTKIQHIATSAGVSEPHRTRARPW